SQPSSTQVHIVPAHPNSMSSGWALMTRARRSLTRPSVWPLRCYGEREPFEATEVEAAIPLGLGRGLDGREAANQGADGDLGFESSQGGTEAVVGTAAEGQVLLGVGTGEVDLIGGGAPVRFVAVRR